MPIKVKTKQNKTKKVQDGYRHVLNDFYDEHSISFRQAATDSLTL